MAGKYIRTISFTTEKGAEVVISFVNKSSVTIAVDGKDYGACKRITHPVAGDCVSFVAQIGRVGYAPLPADKAAEFDAYYAEVTSHLDASLAADIEYARFAAKVAAH